MKTLALFAMLLIIPDNSNIIAQSNTLPKVKKLIATYSGLNENVEFEFISDDDKIYTFQEIGEEVGIDLYEECNFEKKFEITWITQTIEVIDEEGEPTGETEKIQVIISIKEI